MGFLTKSMMKKSKFSIVLGFFVSLFTGSLLTSINTNLLVQANNSNVASLSTQLNTMVVENSVEGAAAESEGESKKKEEESKGEEKGKFNGEEGGEEEEKELPDSATLSVACMLCGAMTFVMAMFYLVNHPDENMRRYSWLVISSTISIFSAVLLFQGMNGLIKTYIITSLGLDFFWGKIVVGFASQAVYMTILFYVLEHCAGVDKCVKEIDLDPETGKHLEELDEEEAKKIELNMTFFGQLFAHINGFAAINTFSLLQQNPFFAQSWLHSLLMAPIALLYTTIVFGLIDKIRFQIEESKVEGEGKDSGVAEQRSEIWNEAAEEAEDDVASLVISFLSVQSIRYGISGVMPDENGEQDGSYSQSTFDLGTSLIVCCLLAGGILGINKVIGQNFTLFSVDEAQKKFAHFISHVMGMTFAWLLLYTANGSVEYLHKDGYLGSADDKVLYRLVVSLIVSFLAFVVITLLEHVENDAQKSADAAIAEGDSNAGIAIEDNIKAVGQLILSIGILIGFSWEKSFDEAIDSISEAASYYSQPNLAAPFTFILTMSLVGIVAPAWKQYIIPKHIQLEEQYAEKINSEFNTDLTVAEVSGEGGGGIEGLGEIGREVFNFLEGNKGKSINSNNNNNGEGGPIMSLGMGDLSEGLLKGQKYTRINRKKLIKKEKVRETNPF